MSRSVSPQVRALVDRIIRVDHAGELGANRIYQGQLMVLGKSSIGPKIKEMHDQEVEHLKKFQELIPIHRVRPTLLLPLWSIAGFTLGVGSALLGSKCAMACTVAVESVISEHYNNQIRELVESDPETYQELLQCNLILLFLLISYKERRTWREFSSIRVAAFHITSREEIAKQTKIVET
ncbi:unnamed protein product [Schistosoma margrebowiei]|uniref:5-demethoxyubiquinone hydroxylase, mitochondrial n=1 Tax=Schistosoma margrebowiei TaxID=48269 RepID=A0AA85ADK4_9TREM|nr:unnamed protein product [Schistosoma margrebowiei]